MGFSDVALKNMIARKSNTTNKVGSQLKLSDPAKYKGYESTDCITFVLNVLRETFEEVGQKSVADSLITYGMASRGGEKKFYGDLLAKALVNKYKWKAIYLTPDRFHPVDGDQEHTFATDRVIKTCMYSNIPVSYTVLDYNPTPKAHEKFQALLPYKERKLNLIDLKAINIVKFGFGISRRGMHTWLFSKGYVYEVHWEQVGKNLYEKRLIKDFPWQSNLIVVPPDAAVSLAASATKCN
jgi:hypothetical protein